MNIFPPSSLCFYYRLGQKMKLLFIAPPHFSSLVQIFFFSPLILDPSLPSLAHHICEFSSSNTKMVPSSGRWICPHSFWTPNVFPPPLRCFFSPLTRLIYFLFSPFPPFRFFPFSLPFFQDLHPILTLVLFLSFFFSNWPPIQIPHPYPPRTLNFPDSLL